MLQLLFSAWQFSIFQPAALTFTIVLFLNLYGQNFLRSAARTFFVQIISQNESPPFFTADFANCCSANFLIFWNVLIYASASPEFAVSAS
jgi:hypothetical protein